MGVNIERGDDVLGRGGYNQDGEWVSVEMRSHGVNQGARTADFVEDQRGAAYHSYSGSHSADKIGLG